MSRRILITGAASGLGRALADACVAGGWRVLLTDANAAAGELARLELAERVREGGGDPDARVAFLLLDVRDDAAWAAAREWCERMWGGLDVLVNNAGVASAGGIADVPMDDWDWIVDINLKGVVRGVRTFVPLFRAQGHGHVVNIASMAGLLNVPSMVAYNVTKAGVVSLSETMRAELTRHGITTTVVCPSFFATSIADNMRATDPALAVMARRMVSGEALPGPKLTAADVARKILRAVDRGRFWVLPHVEGQVLWGLKRHCPPLFTAGLGVVTKWLDGQVRSGGSGTRARERATAKR
jgi:NAD(P)-dependent dehydrogenase (short-subunit alcohol dehydrogenase family)